MIVREVKRPASNSQTVRTATGLADVGWAWAAGARLAGMTRCLAAADGKAGEQLLQIRAAAFRTRVFLGSPGLFEKLHRLSAFVALIFKYRHVSTSSDWS